jgi:hypothetical protein
MRKPVSKHALRRAMEQVVAEGRLRCEDPPNTVVDRLWHHIEKDSLAEGRRKALARRREEPAGA